jgi:hypothetical protein
MIERPQVAVVIRPFHELGLSLCRMLGTEGTRIVVLDRDPAVGEAFCHRLALEGFPATFRFIDPDRIDGEQALHDDLADVYGQVKALITFYEPIATEHSINWLDLSSTAASQLVQRSFDWRLRLLKAMAPLFDSDGGGQVINVLMGLRDGDDWQQRPEALVARMLDDLLAPEWSARGVSVRHVATEVSGFTPGARDEQIERLNRDVARVLDLLAASREAASH